jgi:TRAP-type C4-dicarboxylate transport system permease small subunit
MLEALNRWNGRVTTWLARIAAVILAVLALVTFADVFARYFFRAPFPFTVEMTELAMGTIVFLALGLTTHEQGHITVDIVIMRLSDAVRAVLALVTNAIAFVFLAVMIWQVWVRAGFLFTKGDFTPIWRIPIWPVAMVMGAGGIFLLTGVLLQLLRSVADAKGGKDAP